ncbi:MAG: hypothetical protein WC499_02595 [Patescibacteria group bacterium]
MLNKTIIEKINYLQSNCFGVWLKTRQEVAIEISDKQSMFCVCGRLATGLHENACKKLQDKITTETVKRLEHLIKQKNESETTSK